MKAKIFNTYDNDGLGLSDLNEFLARTDVSVVSLSTAAVAVTLATSTRIYHWVTVICE